MLVRPVITMVNWVILLLTVDNCKRKGKKKKIILVSLLKFRLLNLILMVTFCLLPLLKGGAILIGFLILGVPIICVLTRIGFQYMIQLTQLLFTWAIMPSVM